ncbi:MAG TPA: YetF domain-containing protein [Bryobacteraceae bacterium]|nr:YetF domain-containing protein [Bryobacteraceae bacterium]
MFVTALAGLGPDMFALKLSVLEKVLRPVIVYAFVLICLRIFGKRQLAQLNPFDLVVLLSISNTVQNAIIGDDNSVTGGLIGALALFAINYVVVRFVFRHKALDQVLEGTPTVLIDRGHVRRRALAKELLSESELLSVAHRQGFDSLKEIDHCELQPGGIFYIRGVTPPEPKTSQLLARMEALGQQLDRIEQRLGAG